MKRIVSLLIVAVFALAAFTPHFASADVDRLKSRIDDAKDDAKNEAKDAKEDVEREKKDAKEDVQRKRKTPRRT